MHSANADACIPPSTFLVWEHISNCAYSRRPTRRRLWSSNNYYLPNHLHKLWTFVGQCIVSNQKTVSAFWFSPNSSLPADVAMSSFKLEITPSATGWMMQWVMQVITTDVRYDVISPTWPAPCQRERLVMYYSSEDGGRGAAVCLESPEIAGSNPTLAFKFQRNKIFLPRSLVMIQYCGEACSASDHHAGLESGGQFHLINLTIIRRLSWHNLAYMCI